MVFLAYIRIYALNIGVAFGEGFLPFLQINKDPKVLCANVHGFLIGLFVGVVIKSSI